MPGSNIKPHSKRSIRILQEFREEMQQLSYFQRIQVHWFARRIKIRKYFQKIGMPALRGRFTLSISRELITEIEAILLIAILVLLLFFLY